MAKYFPGLSVLLDSLDRYSLCEKHCNQIVVKKSFIKQTTKKNDSIVLDLDQDHLTILNSESKYP